jgi:hypothetical protein
MHYKLSFENGRDVVFGDFDDYSIMEKMKNIHDSFSAIQFDFVSQFATEENAKFAIAVLEKQYQAAKLPVPIIVVNRVDDFFENLWLNQKK